jgi:hypothetical protein
MTLLLIRFTGKGEAQVNLVNKIAKEIIVRFEDNSEVHLLDKDADDLWFFISTADFDLYSTAAKYTEGKLSVPLVHTNEAQGK